MTAAWIDPDIATVREMLNSPDSHVSDSRMSAASAWIDDFASGEEKL